MTAEDRLGVLETEMKERFGAIEAVLKSLNEKPTPDPIPAPIPPNPPFDFGPLKSGFNTVLSLIGKSLPVIATALLALLMRTWHLDTKEGVEKAVASSNNAAVASNTASENAEKATVVSQANAMKIEAVHVVAEKAVDQSMANAAKIDASHADLKREVAKPKPFFPTTPKEE